MLGAQCKSQKRSGRRCSFLLNPAFITLSHGTSCPFKVWSVKSRTVVLAQVLPLVHCSSFPSFSCPTYVGRPMTHLDIEPAQSHQRFSLKNTEQRRWVGPSRRRIITELGFWDCWWHHGIKPLPCLKNGYFCEWSHTLYILLGLISFHFHSAWVRSSKGLWTVTVTHLHPVEMLHSVRSILRACVGGFRPLYPPCWDHRLLCIPLFCLTGNKWNNSSFLLISTSLVSLSIKKFFSTILYSYVFQVYEYENMARFNIYPQPCKIPKVLIPLNRIILPIAFSII